MTVNTDETRLPKWAQQLITTLRRRAERLEIAVKERDDFIASQHPDSNVRLWGGVNNTPDRNLPPDSGIDFFPYGPAKNRYQSRGIHVSIAHERWKGQGHRVRVDAIDGALNIEPIASNCIYVWHRD